MKVLALARYGRLGASSRLRMFQYVAPLAALGVQVQTAPLLRDAYLERRYGGRPTAWREVAADYVTRLRELLQARPDRLLWIEKELFPALPAWFERGLRRCGLRYVADYDDAVFHQYDQGSPVRRRLLGRKIDVVMENSALVVCGNDYLARRAVAAGAPRVEIVATVIDLARYPLVPGRPAHDPARPWVIGWIGSPATVRYLRLVAPVLARIAAERPLVLRVVGARFSWPGLNVECREWSEACEVDEIRQFDAGIMPLPDAAWERGKCGYKLIQYMACALPVVASPVGVNREIVRDGESGLLAEGARAWAAALRRLAEDPARAAAMGQAGRTLVERNYCLQVTAPRLARLFHETAAQGRA